MDYKKTNAPLNTVTRDMIAWQNRPVMSTKPFA